MPAPALRIDATHAPATAATTPTSESQLAHRNAQFRTEFVPLLFREAPAQRFGRYERCPRECTRIRFAVRAWELAIQDCARIHAHGQHEASVATSERLVVSQENAACRAEGTWSTLVGDHQNAHVVYRDAA